MSSSNSPCAACKFLRRKCTQGCVFAPFFPPDNPSKFANVHRVFGASNVAKLLNELTTAQREDAVNSLAYEAEARLHDPVYGCVGYISILQHRLLLIQRDLAAARKELSTLIGPGAFGPITHLHPFQAAAASQPTMAVPAGMGMGLGLGGQQAVPASMAPMMYRDQHHHHQQEQQMAEVQQLAEAVAVAREREMLRNIEQQQEMERLLGDGSGVVGVAPSSAAAAASPPLTLVLPQMGGFPAQQPLLQGGKLQNELQFHEEHGGHYLHHDHHFSRGSHEGRSGAGPSS